MSDEAVAILSRKKYDLDPLGLRVNKDLSFTDWAGLGAWLEAVEHGIQWCIGDWLNYGEQAFGEQAAQAIDATGWAIDTLNQYRWVCARVHRDIRRPELTFFHHREVAGLEPSAQVEWLERAVTGDPDGSSWTRERLRAEVQSAKPGGGPTAWYVVVSAKDQSDADRLADRMRVEGRTAKLQEKGQKKPDAVPEA